MKWRIFKLSLLIFIPLNLLAFSHLVAADEKACPATLSASANSGQIANYDDEITTLTGPAESFSLSLGKGREFQFEIRRQPEFERRVNLPVGKDSISTVAANLLDHFYGERQSLVRVRSSGTAQINAMWSGVFQLAPLSSLHEHFHESSATQILPQGRRRMGKWNLGQEAEGALTAQLYGSTVYMRPVDRRDWTDYIETKYFVGWQEEAAFYYDTPTHDFEKMGVAIRLKSWFPKKQGLEASPLLPSDENLAKAVRRTLTIKISHPDKGYFTLREEIHVSLPTEVSLAEIPMVLPAVLAKIKETAGMSDKTLVPMKRVNTERIGINLIEKQEGKGLVKIGFITVDAFNRYNIPGDNLPKGPVHQIEVEILPEYAKDLLQEGSRRQELEKLLNQIDVFTGAKENRTPKYLQEIN